MCDQEFRTQRIDPRFPFTNQTSDKQTKSASPEVAGSTWQTVSKIVVFVTKYFRPLPDYGRLGLFVTKIKACYMNYCDYYRCTRLLGEADDCKIFKRYFETICPNFWIEHWDELREKGAFPGRI